MAEAPVVAYDGNVPGYKATRPQKGHKLDPDAADVTSYAGYLQRRHDALVASAGGQKLHGYVYAFNGFSATMTDAQAKQLEQTPGVLTVWKDEELQLDTNRTPALA